MAWVRDRDRDGRENLRDSARDRRQALLRARDRDRNFARWRDWDDDDRRRFALLRTWNDDDRRRFRRGRDWDDDDRWVVAYSRGFFNGCPPGLAKKNPACIPPGHARNFIGARLPLAYRSNLLPLRLRRDWWWRDDDDYYYRYGSGYLYRVDRDTQLIAALLPLFGAGLGIGMPFPAAYSNYYVPSYYQPFYSDYGDDYYRYYNGYVYEIDYDTGLVEDIIPLYDRGYGIGQMLPASYSYYNVPYPYRSHFIDDDDYYYRYAPGAIYRVDRDTRLITAIASLLTGSNGLAVGQPLPLGYSAYNVPFAHRAQYYDTPTAWYRYSDGYIYQVDPTTRLVTALIALAALA